MPWKGRALSPLPVPRLGGWSAVALGGIDCPFLPGGPFFEWSADRQTGKPVFLFCFAFVFAITRRCVLGPETYLWSQRLLGP